MQRFTYSCISKSNVWSVSYRLLEEGKIAEAETEKQRIEKLQRDSRKHRENTGTDHRPKWFRCGFDAMSGIRASVCAMLSRT